MQHLEGQSKPRSWRHNKRSSPAAIQSYSNGDNSPIETNPSDDAALSGTLAYVQWSCESDERRPGEVKFCFQLEVMAAGSTHPPVVSRRVRRRRRRVSARGEPADLVIGEWDSTQTRRSQ